MLPAVDVMQKSPMMKKPGSSTSPARIVRTATPNLMKKCIMSCWYINSFPCSLIKTGSFCHGRMVKLSMYYPMMKSLESRLLPQHQRISSLMRDIAPLTGTMNINGLAPCHFLQESTCRQGRQYCSSARHITVRITLSS